jgi:protein-S-isoprenylcysteine O-methyltransferase Ste14
MAKEQDHPNISPMVHPPLVAVFFIVLAYFLGRFVPLPFAIPPVLQYFGLVLTFIGFLLGIGAFMEFRKAHTTLDPHGSTKHLVTAGIYRFTRNPIYLGFLLMVIGFPLNSGVIWGFVLAPFYMITMSRLVIEKEETYLERKFGKTYVSYTSRVRRWL